jgi:hypothetical protein
LAVADGGFLGAVSVLLGMGDGTFRSAVNYPTGLEPRSVAIGDVDGDLRPDLVTANSRPAVSVLLGKGDGSFGPKSEYGTGGIGSDIVLADLNGDRKLDLAVTDQVLNAIDVGAVSVLLNIGPRSQTLAAEVDLDPKVINLKSRASWVTAYIEPVGFDAANINLSTVRLAGSVQAVSKFAVLGDHDADGIPDLMLKFSREALDPLLTPGRNSLELTGSLVTGESFAGTGEVRVIHNSGGHLTASVGPNPLNPSGVLVFRTLKPGRVRVTIFDLHGRLVRTLTDTPRLPAGEQEVRIDGRGERGEVLPSGVYFYRVISPDGTITGRFAILK